MRDIDIRKVLLNSLNRQYKNDNDTLIIPELGLCQGDARVDLAVVNGVIHGYEIKSERDTLNRLEGQKDIYNKVFDYVTVVAGSCHLPRIKKIVPVWWGISVAKFNNKKLAISEVRPGKKNSAVDPSALVQLLWRDEALSILKQRDIHKGVASKPRNEIWGRLSECLSLEELCSEVRNKIKKRKNWRAGLPQL